MRLLPAGDDTSTVYSGSNKAWHRCLVIWLVFVLSVLAAELALHRPPCSNLRLAISPSTDCF